ncbi:MAG: hypothetical protein AAGA30_22090, partial [Planctomycetota bacterium]
MLQASYRNQVSVLFLITALFFSIGLSSRVSCGQEDKKFPEGWQDQIQWRCVGPANMSGRITSIAVYHGDKSIWWAASASGGLLKTENNGVTFTHQFDREATVSIGDVQVAKT